MKKIIGLLVLITSLLFLTGCGASQEQAQDTELIEPIINNEGYIEKPVLEKLPDELMQQQTPPLPVELNIQQGYSVEGVNTLANEYIELQKIMDQGPDITKCDQITDENLNKICRDWAGRND